MSGKIELKVRKSKPGINPRTGQQWLPELIYYPGWIWEITGEDGIHTNIMPSWIDIEKAIEETIIHEMKVDKITGRKPDTQRYKKFLHDLANKCISLQSKIPDFEIEKIYKECKK